MDLGRALKRADNTSLEQLETELEGSYADFSLRATIVAFWLGALTRFYNLSVAESDGRFEPSETQIEFEVAFLHRCLDALAPTAVESVEQFQWELDVAATLRHPSRVVSLLREWQGRDMPSSYLPIAVRMLFFLFAPTGDAKPPSGTWDPQLQLPGAEQLYGAYSLVAWAYALDVSSMRLSPKLDRPAALTDEINRANLRELRYWVDVAKDAGTLDKPEVLAVQAWTVYALALLDGRPEELERAGALYERAQDMSLPDSTDKSIWWKRWQAATLAYQDAGALDKALQAARGWVASTKEPSPGYRKIAELCARLGRFEEFMSAFENAAGDVSADRDWQDSLVLTLGLEKLQGDAVARAIAHGASQSRFKEQGMELVAWLLPWVPLLGEQARQRLWFGLYAISSPDIMANTGQAAWDNAGDNFGEALAFELKRAVFEPFFQGHPDLALNDKDWRRVRDGRGTLGQMVETLLQSRVPITNAARTLRAWLDQKQPQLVRHMSQNEQKLRQVHRLRGDAQHNQLDPAGVRELFETVCRALDAIHSRP